MSEFEQPIAGPSRTMLPPSSFPQPPEESSPKRRTQSLSPRQRGKLPAQSNNASTIPHTSGSPSVSPSHLLRVPPSSQYLQPPLSAPLSPSPNMRRAVSDEGTQRTRSLTEPSRTPPLALDPDEAALVQLARLKMSTQDQEAMRKMRIQMGDKDRDRDREPGPGQAQGWVHERNGIGIGIGIDEVGAGAVLVDPPDRDSSLTPRPLDAVRPVQIQTTNARQSHDHTIAVVGAPGVGKSTFIRRSTKAWECSTPVQESLSASDITIHTTFCQVPPGGKVTQPRVIRFIELDSTYMCQTPDSSQIWPEGLIGVSGVVLCYDATRASTLARFELLLARIHKASLPMIILACMSDPGGVREVQAAYGNSLGEPYNTGLIEVTTETPEGKSKMRNGLRWLLYKLEQRARRHHRQLNRLQIPNNDSPRITSTSTITPKTKLAPATSAKLSNNTISPITTESIDHQITPGGTIRPLNGLIAGHVRNGDDETTDHRSSGSSLQWMMSGPFSPDGNATDTALPDPAPVPGPGPGLERGAGSGAVQEGSSAGMGRVVSTGTKASVQSQEPSEATLWLSLDELFTKLFSFIVANEDSRFIESFFMTYRRFCAPITLMSEFATRFKEVEEAPIVSDAKNWALMKITGALIDWVAEYPGDAIDPTVRAVYRSIVQAALRHTFMAHLTAELVHIDHETLPLVDDIDASWSLSTAKIDAEHKRASFQSALVLDGDMLYELDSPLPIPRKDASSSVPSFTTSTSTSASASAQQTDSTLTSSVPPSASSGSGSRRMYNGRKSTDLRLRSGAAEGTSSMVSGSELNAGRGQNQNGFLSSANLHRTAGNKSGLPMPGTDFGASQWANAFGVVLSVDPRAFAVDLTRMQWERFAAIRPRDVLRHDMGKEENDPVAQAIAFFNHLSRWVTTLILANPKPKHRAKVYERFLLIAHHLRRLNNYDSLYAVISGMKETSVHRLTQTHALISPVALGSKEFQSHLKLMDPRGGYTLYRRALEADLSHGTAAIPLMTNILGMISRLQTVRTQDIREKDGAVQWDKFAKFGQMLSVIPECQAKGSMVPGEPSVEFKSLIEGMPIIRDEDKLFQRSKMLEPASGVSQGGGTKSFRRYGAFGL